MTLAASNNNEIDIDIDIVSKKATSGPVSVSLQQGPGSSLAFHSPPSQSSGEEVKDKK